MPPLLHAHSAALAAPQSAAELGQGLEVVGLPSAISAAGPRAVFHSLEFFTSRIPNANTRTAYGRAVAAFCGWCDARRLPLLPSPPLWWPPTSTSSLNASAQRAQTCT